MKWFIISIIRMLLLVSIHAWFWSHYNVMTSNLINQILWASSAPFIKVCPNCYHKFIAIRVRVCNLRSLCVPYILSVQEEIYQVSRTCISWNGVQACYEVYLWCFVVVPEEHSWIILCLWLLQHLGPKNQLLRCGYVTLFQWKFELN